MRVVKLQETTTMKVAAVISIFLAFVLMTMCVSALPMEVPGHEEAGREQEVGHEQVGPEQAGRVVRSGPSQAACLRACRRGTAAIQVRQIGRSRLYQTRLYSPSTKSQTSSMNTILPAFVASLSGGHSFHH